MSKQNDSFAFWTGLTTFLDMSVTAETLKTIVDAGVPYFGNKGCFTGTTKCRVVRSAEKLKKGVQLALIPSVCAPE